MALQPVVQTENKITDKYGEVPAVIFAGTYNEETKEISVFALNTNKTQVSETQIDLRSFENTSMTFRTELWGDDLSKVNSLENPDAVSPKKVELSQSDNGIYTVNLKPASWNVIRFSVC